MVLKELILKLLLWEGVVVLKELILFLQFLLLEGLVDLKEMILTVSTFGGCGGLERTNF